MKRNQITVQELIKADPVYSTIAQTPKVFTQAQVQTAELKFEVNKMYSERAYSRQAQGLLQYLVDNRKDLPEDQKNALDNGSLKVYPGRAFFTKQLGNGGVTPLIESSDKQLIGLKSFDATNLPNEMSFVFNKMQLLFGTTQQPVANLSDVVFSSTAPNSDFSNMEFNLLRADIPVFQTVIENYEAAQFENSRYNFDSLLMFTPKKSIKATAGWETGKTFTGVTNYVKVILSGIMVKIQ